MLEVFWITLKGIMRDRVQRGILVAAFVFFLIPALSTLSMRQVTELSATLALSLLSLVLLLTAVFLGGTSLWGDMDKRYTLSFLGLPVSRRDYLLGKFSGLAAFVVGLALLMALLAALAIWVTSQMFPPDRPVAWSAFILAILFDSFKYVLLVAFGFLFSSLSTSFFLPVFGTIATFLVGSASQDVYTYLQSSASKSLPATFKVIVEGLYYLVPNFSAFDLKTNAIYGVPLSMSSLAVTAGYFLLYLSCLLLAATWIFDRREMK